MNLTQPTYSGCWTEHCVANGYTHVMGRFRTILIAMAWAQNRGRMPSKQGKRQKMGYDNCEIRTHALSEYDLNVPP